MQTSMNHKNNQHKPPSSEGGRFETQSRKGSSLDSASRDGTLRSRFQKRLRLAVELSPAKQEACAHDMNIDTSLISHYTAGRADMPAWRLVSWTQTYGPETLAWIAAQCGYDLIPAGEAMFGDKDLKTLVQLAVESLGQLASMGMAGEYPLDGWRRHKHRVDRIVEALEAKEEGGSE